MRVKTWNIEQATGYKPVTTFYEDLSIADWFGVSAIKDTYRNVFANWRGDTEFFTEFVMALNWKIWEHYQSNEQYAKTYNDLYEKAREWVFDNWEDKDLEYFVKTTD